MLVSEVIIMKRPKRMPRLLVGLGIWMLANGVAQTLRRNPALRHRLAHGFQHRVVKPIRHELRRRQIRAAILRRLPRMAAPA